MLLSGAARYRPIHDRIAESQDSVQLYREQGQLDSAGRTLLLFAVALMCHCDIDMFMLAASSGKPIVMVRLSVCPSVCVSHHHTHCNSPRGQHMTWPAYIRSDNNEDRPSCFLSAVRLAFLSLHSICRGEL